MVLLSVGLRVAYHAATRPTVPSPFPIQITPYVPGPIPTWPTVATAPPGSYPRERVELTSVELTLYGGLHKGDCLDSRPKDLSQGVTPVDCSLPHTDQVMGFVDLSEGMPSISSKYDFEVKVAQRCNALMATLPIPDGFKQGVAAEFPDGTDWNKGVRAALCWVPVFNKTWVGSAIDGTATPI